MGVNAVADPPFDVNPNLLRHPEFITVTTEFADVGRIYGSRTLGHRNDTISGIENFPGARDDAHSKRENHQKNFVAFFISDVRLEVYYYETKIARTMAH